MQCLKRQKTYTKRYTQNTIYIESDQSEILKKKRVQVTHRKARKTKQKRIKWQT